MLHILTGTMIFGLAKDCIMKNISKI